MPTRTSVFARAMIDRRALFLFLWPILIAAAAWSAPAATAEPSADLRGIYVDSVALPIPQDAEARLSEALQAPGVDGLVLVLRWSSIEPQGAPTSGCGR